MNKYNNIITLTKNFRGVYGLDTSKGCFYGMSENKKGCYGECYAAKSAKTYGKYFNNSVLRIFKDVEHVNFIRNQLYNIDMPFFRIGVFGDPSENWAHTLKIVNIVSGIKPIVIVTKHWNTLTKNQLNELLKYDVCVNTSISALDKSEFIKHRLNQYNTLKNYCKSVLRVVTCKFNINNLQGLIFNETQKKLLNNEYVIDNVLRVGLGNYLVKMGIINVEKKNFLSKDAYFSQSNKSTFTGSCKDCPDMCGIYTNKLNNGHIRT
jgi:hypothetical protein